MAVMSFVLQDEIFDMVKPTDPYRISLQDLVNRSVNNLSYKGMAQLWNKLPEPYSQIIIACERALYLGLGE